MHQIKGNKTTRTPGQHIVIQAIVDTEENSCVLGVTIKRASGFICRRFRPCSNDGTREVQVQLANYKELWSWIAYQLNPKIGTWIWVDDLVAHAEMMRIDYAMAVCGLVYSRSVWTPKASYLKCKMGECSLVLLDRRNWFRGEMSELYDNVLDYGGSEYDMGIEDMDSIGYAKCVVMLLHRLVTSLCKFIRFHDLGVMQLTASAQSLTSYRHRFAPKRHFVYTPKTGKNKGTPRNESRCFPDLHDNQEVKQLEESAFYGGPTHVYYVGKVDEPIHVLDVASLYPHVMMHNVYPCKLSDMKYVGTDSVLSFSGGNVGCIACVRLNAHTNTYPKRDGENTIYASGRFATTLAGPELNRAVRHGEVEDIFAHACYFGKDLFSQFVNEFYGIRKTAEECGDTVYAGISKVILNSLWAKFAQKTGEWLDRPDIPADLNWGYWHGFDPKTQKPLLLRALSWNTQALVEPKFAPHSFLAIPAFVCSYARVYMDELISIAKSGGNVWYSAVDSIHCDAGARKALQESGKIGNQLGLLRCKMVASSGEYMGVGDYTLDGHRTKSGLPVRSLPSCYYCKNELCDDHMICPDCGRPWDGITYSYVQSEFAANMIERGPSGRPTFTTVFLRQQSGYKFGKVLDTGWVIPYHLGDENATKEKESRTRQDQ